MLVGLPASELAFLAVALLSAGALTGLLAGLFGVGGGAIIVPVLYEVFRVLGVPEAVRMPLCVGTSLAIIIPTSVRSLKGHFDKGAVDMAVLRAWAIPVVVGVVTGSAVARYAAPFVFKLVFMGVASLNATKLLFGNENWRFKSDLPKGPLMQGYGFVIGILSALMGIGGGALSTMLMGAHGRPIRQSVATSSGLGVLISIPGAIGYVIAGWPQMDILPPVLPVGSIGYVSLLGFALMIPTALLATPYGVALAHSLPKRRLEIAFGIFLLLVALRFLAALLGLF